jgi:hypothetical protein
MPKSSKKPIRKSGAGIGYGCPPARHRWKPGQSGNPSGRPKKSPDLAACAAKELSRKRWVTIDGRRVRVPTDQILIQKLIASGKIPAINLLFDLVSRNAEKDHKKKIEYIKAQLDMSPQEAMEAFRSTMSQPAWYDEDFDGDLEPTIKELEKKEKDRQKKKDGR